MPRRIISMFLMSCLVVTLVPALALSQGKEGKEGEHAMPEMGPPKQMKEIVGMSGVYDVSTPDRIETFLNSSEDVEAASPLLQVAGNDVPFFITIGENDSAEHRW